MVLTVAPEMQQLGVSAAALVARGIDNSKTSPELLAYRRAVGKNLALFWKNRSISAHPAIQEFHRVHEAFGVPVTPSSPEKTILYVRRHRDFPAAGAIVDCYNIVSARTVLSLGAHDLDQISLPVTIRRLTRNDHFQPLGSQETQNLEGEFGYVDSGGRVICRLDVLQCEPSKVTKNSRSVAIFLQGNRCLSPSTLLKGAWLLSEMLSVFCNGEVELTGFFTSAVPFPTDAPKAPVQLSEFKRLKLVTGTIVRLTPLNGIPLTSATIQSNGEIEALAPGNLTATSVGQTVIVAARLHPLMVAGRQFTAYLPALHSSTNGLAPVPTRGILDGKRLF